MSAEKSTQKKAILVGLSAIVFAAAFPEKAAAVSLALTCPVSLIYGDIVPCGSPGTAKITSAGVRSGTCVTFGGAPFQAGRCFVTQKFPFKNILVSATATKFFMTLTTGTKTMSVTGFDLGNGASTVSFTAPPLAFKNIPVGATLNIDGAQAGGTYVGAITINAVLF